MPSTTFACKLRMKPEHAQKAFWVLPDSRIILESSSPVYKEAEALLIAIANPVSRTRFLQEYQLKSTRSTRALRWASRRPTS